MTEDEQAILDRLSRRVRWEKFKETMSKLDQESFYVLLGVVVFILAAAFVFVRLSDNFTNTNTSNHRKQEQISKNEQELLQSQIDACQFATNIDACLIAVVGKQREAR